MNTPALLLRVSLLLLTISCSTSQKAPRAEQGYQAIFDGKTLNGWEYDSTYWHVRDGVLVGEITPETLVKQNTFIIWRGGQPRDFELLVDYRISALGNSGINYRSEDVPGVAHALKGYQADLDGRNRYSGQNYEERGRKFLALRGQRVRLLEGQPPQVLDSLGGGRAALGQLVKPGEWNQVHVIAKGNHLQHYINGALMSDVTDDDATNRKMGGWIGVQVHVGPPMKIEYKNFRLKTLQ
ncbi:3-keto-disaccharide hydrolase [Hymenobacter jejuensis]|uniref:DUF1080 domain-containing protein n=1 Tax=Hymenobacter jejuensis TaxID=2502781 RepID=A0A5B8A4U1_9BACT|nr:DUF1080 domain-containing protein [Hymenobacter jejuensis]QDA61605.1 DUF1080 domain-containing protein [Hymenobacter jejuensis]